MFKYVSAAILVALFFIQPVQAREPACEDVSTDNGRNHLVIFINGIANDIDEACKSLNGLKTITDSHADQSDFELFYNPTSGEYSDIAKLRIQARISDRAVDIAQNDYTILLKGASARYNFVLGKLYFEKMKGGKYESDTEEEVYNRANKLYFFLRGLVRQGKKITVVAHSQGNFYIEAAIAMMRYRGETNAVNSIKVVSVAPTSSTTPNGTYVSLSADKALGLQRSQTSTLKYYKVLASNADACVSTLIGTCAEFAKLSDQDWMLHGFIRVYLNPNFLVNGISIRSRIRDQVIRSRDVLNGVVKPAAVAKSTKRNVDQRATFRIMLSYAMLDTFTLNLEHSPREETGIKYVWDFGDGKISERDMPSINHYYNEGVYTAKLTVTYRSGAIATCSKVITLRKPYQEKDPGNISQTCQ